MGRQKKNQVRPLRQRQMFYSNARTFGGEETEQKANALTLDGSADIADSLDIKTEIHEEVKVKKPSFLSQILLHAKEEIIVAVLIPTLLGLGNFIIDLKAKQRYINHVLDELKTKIEKIEQLGSTDNYTIFVTKENLELKLELIERDLQHMIPDTTKIEQRLNDIENEIKEIRGKK